MQTHQGQKGVNAELDERRYKLADLVGRAHLDKSLSYLALFGCEAVLSTYGINVLNNLLAELRTQPKVKQQPIQIRRGSRRSLVELNFILELETAVFLLDLDW